MQRATDSNNRRRPAQGKLAVPRLKPTAIPRIFPGCPSYLTKKKLSERPKVCQSEERRRRLIIKTEKEAEAFLGEDEASSLEGICQKHYDFPSSWNVTSMKVSSKVIFEGVEFHLDGKPFFKFSLTIDDQLCFNLTCNEVEVATSAVNHITPSSSIERHSDVVNILAFLNSKADSTPTTDDLINDSIKTLTLLRETDPTRAEAWIFLLEQLKLAQMPPNSRRYSPQLLWTCLRWMKTSGALYNALLSENFLFLPSTSHLKRLGSAYSLESGLSEATTAYLSERIKSLSDRDKTVAVLIDEVILVVCKHYHPI